jgi:16S rRNA G966 N2-methylase RsmD
MGKLLNSDAETELSRFKNEVDFVFFDPPYRTKFILKFVDIEYYASRESRFTIEWESY